MASDYEVQKFIYILKRSGLTAQQKRTLKGQALAGDLEGAKRGYLHLVNNTKREAM